MEKKRMIIAVFDSHIKEEKEFIDSAMVGAKSDYVRFFQQHSDSVYKSAQMKSLLEGMVCSFKDMKTVEILDYIKYTIDCNLKALRTQRIIKSTTSHMVNLASLLDTEVTQHLLAFLEKVYNGHAK